MGGNLTSHTPAHNLLLPLLPSGPGGVYRSLLRGDRLDHHSSLRHSLADGGYARGAHYHQFVRAMQGAIFVLIAKTLWDIQGRIKIRHHFFASF